MLQSTFYFSFALIYVVNGIHILSYLYLETVRVHYPLSDNYKTQRIYNQHAS